MCPYWLLFCYCSLPQPLLCLCLLRHDYTQLLTRRQHVSSCRQPPFPPPVLLPSAYVNIHQQTPAHVSICHHMSAYVSIRQHTSAYLLPPLPCLESLSPCPWSLSVSFPCSSRLPPTHHVSSSPPPPLSPSLETRPLATGPPPEMPRCAAPLASVLLVERTEERENINPEITRQCTSSYISRHQHT